MTKDVFSLKDTFSGNPLTEQAVLGLLELIRYPLLAAAAGQHSSGDETHHSSCTGHDRFHRCKGESLRRNAWRTATTDRQPLEEPSPAYL